MNEESATGSSGKMMIGVKVDRFWNRHWRLLLFIGVIVLSSITGAMWMSTQRSHTGGLLETEWRDHYTDEKQTGSKVVFQSPSKNKPKSKEPGINVYEDEESLEDYINEEEDPHPDDVEYYYDDKTDPALKSRVDENYGENYEVEERKAVANKTAPEPIVAYMPELKDYTLNPAFADPFKSLPQSHIEFEDNYNNPCWAESIPRWPYQNNSYLLIDEQQKLIDPVFQGMRRRFAGRTKPQTRWRLRCLPAFYVIETPPLATPNLFTALSYHPKIAVSQVPEPEYWNKHGPNHVARLRDYVDLFDSAAQQIQDNATRSKLDDGSYYWRHTRLTGDGSSSYLWAFDPWQKVAGNDAENAPKLIPADFIYKLTPFAKLVFVLRNPTNRLFQGYLSRTDAPSKSDFHDKVGQALEKMTRCEKTRSVRSCLYDGAFNRALPVRLRIGMYYPFIADWLRVFPVEQVMFIRYEDYITSPSEIINNVCKFLGIPPFPIKDLELIEQRIQATERKRKATQMKMLSTTKAMLKEFHRHLNEKLADLLHDDKFTWPELAATEIEGGADATQPVSEEEQKRKEKQAAAIEEQRKHQLEAQDKRKAENKAIVLEWRRKQLERRRNQREQRQSGSAHEYNRGEVKKSEESAGTQEEKPSLPGGLSFPSGFRFQQKRKTDMQEKQHQDQPKHTDAENTEIQTKADKPAQQKQPADAEKI